jgi:hypothetical protein
MGKLASLVVDLQVETAALRKGLDDANKKLDDLGEHASKIGDVLGEAFSFEVLKEAGASLAEFVMGGAEAADKMGKLAQSVGAPVEDLSKLAYAAGLSGTSNEQLGVSLEKLSKQMAAAEGGGKDQVALFEALGISITDANGKMRSSTDVLKDVSEKFAGLEDGAAKTAIAQELFGKSGAELIPLLNEGKDGLESMGDEAQRFGMVVTKDGAESAKKFNESIDRLKAVGEGLAIKVAQQVTPALTSLAGELLSGAKSGGTLDAAATVLTTTLKTLASGGAIIAGIFDAVGKVLAGVAASVLAVVHGDFGGAREALSGLGSALEETATTTKTRLESIWSDAKGPGDALEQQADKAKGAADEIIKQQRRIKAEMPEVEVSHATGAKSFDSRLAEMASGKASKVAEAVAKRSADLIAAAAEKVRQAFEGLADKFAGRTGKLPGLVQSAQMGAAATGGSPYGAIAGAAIDLLSQSQQFNAIVGQLDTLIGYIADTLGEILGPALKALAPVLGFVAGLFKVLQPLFEFLGKVLGFVVGILAGFLNGVAMMWNALIDMVDDILGFLGVDLRKYKLQLIDLTQATQDQTKAAQDAADAFSNVPEGYRTAAAIFNASNPVVGGGLVGSGIPQPGAGGTTYINTTINAGQMDPDDLYDLWQRKAKADASRRTGRTLTEGRFSFNPL